jgi:hypothetical protein
VDMTVFPTAGHLASWAGRCPGNNLTDGKRCIGKKKAAIAVGHSILVIAWHLLTSDATTPTLAATTSSDATPIASVNGLSPSSRPSLPRHPRTPRRVPPGIHVSG